MKNLPLKEMRGLPKSRRVVGQVVVYLFQHPPYSVPTQCMCNASALLIGRRYLLAIYCRITYFFPLDMHALVPIGMPGDKNIPPLCYQTPPA